MIWKILKKDLQKNKVTNILLFLLICISIVLLSGAITLLLSDTSSINSYLDNSHVANLSIYYFGEETHDEIIKWANESEYVDSYIEEKLYSVSKDAIDIEKIDEVNSELLLSIVPNEYNYCYTLDNEKITKVNDGEAYLPNIFKNKLSLEIGNEFEIKIGEKSKKFVFKGYFKDSVLLNDFFTFKKILLSKNDLSYLSENEEPLYMLNVFSSNETKVEKDFNKQGVNVISAIPKSLLKMVFVFDLVIAGVLGIVSILLVVIALICLIFTIKFTLKKNYHEIGVMKAIGIDNTSIRFLYLAKYTFITILSLVIGYIISIPLENILLRNISETAVIKANASYYLISFIGALLTSILIVLVGYASTFKITKIKPVLALKGEMINSSKRKTKISVASSYKSPILMMAIKDNVKHLKRTIMLIIVFVLSMLTIIIPSNALDTLNSDKVVPMFGYSNFDYQFECKEKTIVNYKELDEYIEKIENVLNENDVEYKLYVEVRHAYSVRSNYEDEAKRIYCLKSSDISTEEYACLGRAPKYSNEVSIGTKTAEYFNVSIGDTIYIKIGNEEKDFIITSTFDTMMNMGHGLRFGNEYVDEDNEFSEYGIFIRTSEKETKIREIFDDKDTIVRTANEAVNRIIGSVRLQFSLIKRGVVLLILLIEFVFVTLICKLILDRDYSEFALLKSLGFKNSVLIRYEIYRISICALVSIIITSLISYPLTLLLINPIFSIMGMTKPMYVIDILQAYLIYPLLVSLVGLIGVLTTYRTIRKIKAIEVKE